MFCALLYIKKRGCYIFYIIIKTKLLLLLLLLLLKLNEIQRILADRL
jgi:hypothetical protein